MLLHEQDFQALEDLGREEHARMSEKDFTTRLLPHLIPPVVPDKRPRDLSIWLEAAGNAQRLIDVVDRNDVILFTVPPILSRSPTSIPEKDTDPDNDLGETGAIYELRIGTEPAHVVNEWYFNSLVSKSFSPEIALTYLYAQMWVQIYRRYNIPLERLFGEKSAAIDKVVAGQTAADTVKDAPKNEQLDDDDFDPM